MRIPFLTPLLTGAAFFVISIVSSGILTAAPSLVEVVAGLDSTSPALAEANINLATARAAYTASRALPNPAIFAEGQSLRATGIRETEQTFGVQQSMGFLWSQSPQTAAKKLAYEAAQADYEEKRRELVARVAVIVGRYRSLAEQSLLLDTVLVTARRAQDVMVARHREGDVSEYDAKRLYAELIQLQLRKIQLSEEANRTAAEFVEATGHPARILTQLQPPELPLPAIGDVEDAVQLALTNRPALQARARAAEARRMALAAAKLNQLPDFAIGVGRKTANPNLSGWLWQAELEIPLWGQRRSERNLARAEQKQAQTLYEAARHQAEQEVRAAFDEWTLLHDAAALPQTFSRSDAEISLNRGIQLHSNGEFSSAELVDALRSSVDALAAHLDLQTAFLSVNLKLRRVTGLPILE